MTSKSDAKSLLKVAEYLGFSYEGMDGQGHHTVVHPNGRYTIAATPSEYRGVKNAIADLERIAGKKVERPHHRRSKKRGHTTGFDLDKAKAESETWHGVWSARIETLLAKRSALIDACRRDAALGAYRHLPRLIEAIKVIEDTLTSTYHQPVDEPFDPFTLADL